MDRIKILVIDCQRTLFLGFRLPTAKECLWGNMQTLLDSGIVADYLRQNLSLSLTEVFCPCLKENYIIL